LKVLLVEDEAPKQKKLKDFILRVLPHAQIVTAKSVRSAIDSLRKEPPNLILLDMSLPTFDIGEEESGGRPQGFGGIEVMRYLDRAGIRAPVVVVTAFEAFSEKNKTLDLDALSAQLRHDHPINFRELVYYNTVLGNWVFDLEEALAGILKKDKD